MTSSVRVTIAALAMAALSACAPRTDEFAPPGEGYPEASAAGMAAVDWSAAETVEIELSAYQFSPPELMFRTATPYRLVLTNSDSGWHNFTSEGFFRSIVAYELRTPEEVVTNPRLMRIAVPPGGKKELEFVAIKPGRYDFECTVFSHATLGMTGAIEVQ